MPIIHLMLIIALIGLGLWLINQYVPMDAKIKTILNIVVVLVLILWLLSVFGVIGSLSTVRVGR